MATRTGSKRRKTRTKMKKPLRKRGKISISRYFQKFNEGDRVTLMIDPSVHSAMPYKRFLGKAGKIIGKRGACYIVEIKDFNAKKKAIIHPVHLQKVENKAK